MLPKSEQNVKNAINKLTAEGFVSEVESQECSNDRLVDKRDAFRRMGNQDIQMAVRNTVLDVQERQALQAREQARQLRQIQRAGQQLTIEPQEEEMYE